ncbi:MAG: 5-formyltetrahydrofolate cyclo-ligase [Rhodospirillaceae bacterium]|nr:5-formyltetrahydrofolate cyclo-ligase [Rhodospirillaceae bacterium]
MNWTEVKAWRKTARAKLIAARIAIPATLRAQWTKDLAANLRPILAKAPPPISFYWPFKAEPDLRSLMRELDAQGIAIALPVAIRLGEPMTFRPWTSGAPMERGIWDIPIPATTEKVLPQTLIAPLVGFDGANYRLGYGGGFFDRTLAKLGPEAQAIGVGFSLFGLATIHPQAHDVAMARLVTEAAIPDIAVNASPVCYADAADAVYAGFLPDVDLAAAIECYAAVLPPERLPLLDFVLWRLGATPGRRDGETAQHSDPADGLSRLLPRIRDNTIHAAVRILRDSLENDTPLEHTAKA